MTDLTPTSSESTDERARRAAARSIRRDEQNRALAADLATRHPSETPHADARQWLAFLSPEQQEPGPAEPQPPAHGLAVGDVLTEANIDQMPVGSVAKATRDVVSAPRRFTRISTDREPWQDTELIDMGNTYSHAEVLTLGMVVHSLPEPAVVAPPADPDERPARTGGWENPKPDENEDGREYVERVLGQALGAASVAWTAGTRGTFESAYVSDVLAGIMTVVDRYADGDGAHVEIGGQRMTEAQYNAVRESIVGVPAPLEPKVGDRVRVTHARTRFHAACVGHTGVLDQLPGRPNTYRVHDETTGQAHHGPLSDFEVVAPTAPAPEPRVGDEVRVIDNPVGLKRHEAEGHRPCGGNRGTLQRHNERLSDDDEYVAGGHIGPLSDFERVGD